MKTSKVTQLSAKLTQLRNKRLGSEWYEGGEVPQQQSLSAGYRFNLRPQFCGSTAVPSHPSRLPPIQQEFKAVSGEAVAQTLCPVNLDVSPAAQATCTQLGLLSQTSNFVQFMKTIRKRKIIKLWFYIRERKQ
jgi:hypothetical protein